MNRSAPLFLSGELRHIEAAAAAQALMQRAGLAAADLAAARCRDRGSSSILVLAGPGNNGGDAFEAARLLRARFFDVHTVFLGQPERLPGDAAAAFLRFTQAGGTTSRTLPEGKRWSLIMDGLFGIGLTRDIGEPYASLIDQANRLASRDRCPLLALDCPSGLDADTGRRHGATIRASHTLTFIAAKPGLYTADGPDHCGIIETASLGLDAERICAPAGRLNDTSEFADCLLPRRRNSHKGSYGSTGLVGGAESMTGAALLAARAALRLGSGRVYVGLLDDQGPSVDPLQPELMLRAPEALLGAPLTAMACGPGLGVSSRARELLAEAIALDMPLVLDADALNLVAAHQPLGTALAARRADTVLTPHPAEAARLLQCEIATIQADRLAACLELAQRFRAFVALKGCGTLIAAHDGRWRINASGNPGLATAGSGDVLTGIIAALIAQGWPAWQALLASVHLHGSAADRLAAQGCGPIGLSAGELIDSARRCLNEWVAESLS